MKKITVLTAAVLAVATVLAAGLTVPPSSVQYARASQCVVENDENVTVFDACPFSGFDGYVELD
jgi:hypothetical protein